MKLKQFILLAAFGLTASATFTSCEDILGHWEKPTPVTPTPSGSEEESIPGLLTGKFTINASGDQVQFSQGNLQYQASTKTWRFAENQYDYVGDASNGNVYVESTKSNNISISETYTGWIDLFGWGTAGHEFTSGYGTKYQPWETDNTTGSDYGPTDGTSGLTGTYAEGDWGSNMGTGWRTLTGDTGGEWEYLFNTRSASTIGTTENARFAKAKVNNVQGMILFPDTYTHPDGVTLPTGINDTDDTGWNGNVYTAANWEKMEAAGAVFLPAAGFRNGTSVSSAGSNGLYWSSSPGGSGPANASYVLFRSSSQTPAITSSRDYGYSVRLVRPVE